MCSSDPSMNLHDRYLSVFYSKSFIIFNGSDHSLPISDLNRGGCVKCFRADFWPILGCVQVSTGRWGRSLYRRYKGPLKAPSKITIFHQRSNQVFSSMPSTWFKDQWAPNCMICDQPWRVKQSLHWSTLRRATRRSSPSTRASTSTRRMASSSCSIMASDWFRIWHTTVSRKSWTTFAFPSKCNYASTFWPLFTRSVNLIKFTDSPVVNFGRIIELLLS